MPSVARDEVRKHERWSSTDGGTHDANGDESQPNQWYYLLILSETPVNIPLKNTAPAASLTSDTTTVPKYHEMTFTTSACNNGTTKQPKLVHPEPPNTNL